MLQRTPVPYDYRLSETLARLRNPGALLVSTLPDGRSNAMIIGWGAVGVMWARPVFVVMVRPSRYTYGIIEAAHVFTVNVPPDPATDSRLAEWVKVCGTRSGRDVDKFGAYDTATSPARNVPSITVDACPLVYECRVVHHNDLIPANLLPEFDARSYPEGDYHRYYYGEILGTYAAG